MNQFSIINFKYRAIRNFVSVIIPVYKDSSGLIDTVNSLLPHLRFNSEIIIGNDGSDNKISEVCKKYNLIEVSSDINIGSYAIRNRAMEQSKGEILAFTDANCVVSSNWINTGTSAIQNGYDYVGGQILIDKSKIRTITNIYVNEAEFETANLFTNSHYVPTANLFVKRAVFENLGGFDNRIYSAGDYEFGDRIYHDRKYKMYYNKDLIVKHPPRHYIEFINKLRRITQGEKSLIKYYPSRFSKLRKKSFPYAIDLMLSPRKFKSISNPIIYIKVYILSIWFDFLRWHYTVLK